MQFTFQFQNIIFYKQKQHKALIATALHYLNSNYRLPAVIDLLHFEGYKRRIDV